MIDFPIVDTHLHLWDINHLSYPWLNDIPKLNRTFLLEDYKEACGGIEVEKMIFIQCECDPSQYKQEVEWVTGLAQKDPRLQGIVSWAPLEKGEEVRPEIELLKDNPLVKGIRRIIQFEPDLEFCLQPDFIKGVNMLSQYNLTFDICISHKHNQSVIKLLDQCPGVPMILDHIGKPDIKNQIMDPWKEEILEISKFPNVCCKLSSIATEADHDHWTLEDLRPYVDHIVACFGVDRLIYASDWPVSTLAADLMTCVSTLWKLLEEFSREDLQKLFLHNAIQFYGV
jgi:L-fuconolactonase